MNNQRKKWKGYNISYKISLNKKMMTISYDGLFVDYFYCQHNIT